MSTSVWNDAVRVAVVRSAGEGDRIALVDYARREEVITTLVRNGIPEGGTDYHGPGALDRAISAVQEWCSEVVS